LPPRLPTRFGITRHVPLYLRTMNADGDRRRLAINQSELSATQGDQRLAFRLAFLLARVCVAHARHPRTTD
jgi:hypothetical protein